MYSHILIAAFIAIGLFIVAYQKFMAAPVVELRLTNRQVAWLSIFWSVTGGCAGYALCYSIYVLNK